MKTIAIESPYAGQVARNLEYLDKCILDCLSRGETPYASHRMLTSALDDTIREQRDIGIGAGFHMSCSLEMRAFYVDYGWSDGMLLAKQEYDRLGLKYWVRRIL